MMPTIRNQIRCDECGRDVPFGGNAAHTVRLVPDIAADTVAIDMTCTATRLSWWQRTFRWFR